jgi:glycosyltransferase involved in cell wall biosynthesis
LVVAGNCERYYLAAVKALGDSARLTGFVKDEVLCALHEAAQVVWFPSRYEGFGMPVLEAMARGTCVVTSNTTAIPEVAGEAALLVSPKSVNENVEALDYVLNDSVERKAFGQLGKARAQQFTWTRAASDLRNHFLSLM